MKELRHAKVFNRSQSRTLVEKEVKTKKLLTVPEFGVAATCSRLCAIAWALAAKRVSGCVGREGKGCGCRG